jgi:cytochrome c peroxidase
VVRLACLKTFRYITGLILGIFSLVLILESCRKKEVLHSTTPVAFSVPSGFPSPFYNFTANPLNEEAIALGKKLFYEGRLSIDNFQNCGSCHVQQVAFTTPSHDRSHGIAGSHTLRNAPVLFNLAWYLSFFQDGSRKDLEAVIRSHIASPIDMGENPERVIEKLDADAAYRKLFEDAYGSAHATEARLLDALKQFLLTMVSADSKYDRVQKGAATFTTQEQSGYTIFKNKCNNCHREPLFTDLSFRNNGLPLDFLNDEGRKRVTGLKEDSLKFRVPTLRNIHLSSYYFHDGRISNYRGAINHYRQSVQQGPTLDPLLANGIPLSDTDVDNLVLFLQTLTDTSFINDPRFH